MAQLSANLLNDIDAINRIPAVANILEVICRSTGMGFAAVARVTDQKWIACAVKDNISFGLKSGGELQLETTICDEIRHSHQAVVIDHVAEDGNFATHHTPLMYGFQSYISMPIMLKSGQFFGTLCAIDPAPHLLNTVETRGMFVLFSDLIAFHLDAIYQLDETITHLNEERQTADLREQFIAILGHDLRNPVGAVMNAAQVLLRMPLDERSKRLATIVQDASYRMKSLIDNILDFARGRLGGGILLQYELNTNLKETLMQVITELRLIWPKSEIIAAFNLNETIDCDNSRVAQLFSNLLGNALSHGLANAPIIINGDIENDEVKLSITNQGEKISDVAMKHLFKPFSRGEVKVGQQGLGLGLYISSEIARAHQGNLTVSSTDEATSFVFRFPIKR